MEFFFAMNLLKRFFLSQCIFSGARGKWGGRKQKLWRTSLLTFHEVSWLLFETNLWLILFQFNFESLFRSLHYALMDNCCREYLFLVDFYMASGTASQDLFNAIMSKTLQTYLARNCKSCDWCLTFLVFFVFLQSFLFTVWFFFLPCRKQWRNMYPSVTTLLPFSCPFTLCTDIGTSCTRELYPLLTGNKITFPACTWIVWIRSIVNQKSKNK